jgi:aconitate hydratase
MRLLILMLERLTLTSRFFARKGESAVATLIPRSLDSFRSRKTLTVEGKAYEYFSLPDAEANGLPGIAALPYSLKVLLENLLRFEDGRTVTADDIKAVAQWLASRSSAREIAFRPARVLMQDFTGVPAVVDLAAMREAMQGLGGDTARINPLVPVDLVIDHSVMVDSYGTPRSFQINTDLEYQRNKERYEFLRWGASAFDNFRVVPPGTGICHQVNLEYLAQTVWTKEEGGAVQAFPDTLLGTDSHTTMVNALAVLGWGVGGIEAEAAMLGQPVSMLLPEVVGFRFVGSLREGVTATDLVLTVTEMLRRKGVVGKFVEYFGAGLDSLSLEDRATIANMAPEYGATCGFFPADKDTTAYLRASGRDPHRVALVEAYAKAQGMWREAGSADPAFSSTLELDLSTVEPCLAGPKRPQDRVPLSRAADGFSDALAGIRTPQPGSDGAKMISEGGIDQPLEKWGRVEGESYSIADGHVVIAAITSCTNTSNPTVLIAAGLLARKANEKGLKPKPWVKTSLAPGSQVVTDYLTKSGLQADLNALGFNLAGYGCTTCIGNSGPLPEAISKAIQQHDLIAAAVLSGNRNFEGRVNPDVRANYLASPPLVVAYALAGTMKVNLAAEPIGIGKGGAPVYLRDIWPSSAEIAEYVRAFVTPDMFKARYADVFKGDARWQAVGGSITGRTYEWDRGSTYVRKPPFFEGLDGGAAAAVADIEGARILGLFLDSITTDHISPAGSIKKTGPAGKYLLEHGVSVADFNSYGARRGNHEVMMRGTFANIRIRNQMTPGVEGGVTVHYPDGGQMPIYEAAMAYKEKGTPLVIFAGREYGTGSSRDWAAKGTLLLGVRAVIAQSFERIHRSNLVGMGVLPLVFEEGMFWQELGLKGSETVTIKGIGELSPGAKIVARIAFADGVTRDVPLVCRIDTLDELNYYKSGGILPYVLRKLAAT